MKENPSSVNAPAWLYVSTKQLLKPKPFASTKAGAPANEPKLSEGVPVNTTLKFIV